MSLGALECKGDPLYSASADLECAFYDLQLPIGMEACFQLPPIRACALGITTLAGEAVDAEAVLVAFCRWAGRGPPTFVKLF